ncbi:MAG: UDP-N-acetylmuramate--L-alanine ligase, partial [bacterium]|nr:UDP-N-acetylmuramate--L-alanine ligase [bacterium]
LPGIHNVYNALAAIGVGLDLDIEFKAIKKGLREFKGIQRRFQVRARNKNITWIDDYAHHPTEIKMTLKAAKEVAPGRVVALFQPHRYSRTKALFEEFLTAFYDADVLILSDIYAAGEKPLPDINAQKLYSGLKKHGHKDVTMIGKLPDAEKHLIDILEPDDFFLTLGAGNVWTAGENTMRALAKTKKSARE